jgi:hypothetical protein
MWIGRVDQGIITILAQTWGQIKKKPPLPERGLQKFTAAAEGSDEAVEISPGAQSRSGIARVGSA